MAKRQGFFLGGVIDPKTGKRRGDELVHYEPGDLTTHGVIVGMTGSGKTGLGVIYLEEALRSGLPALILDPKGDMTNLLLTFPDLAPDDFRPWVDEAAAKREGKSPDDLAAETARLWSSGLESWGPWPHPTPTSPRRPKRSAMRSRDSCRACSAWWGSTPTRSPAGNTSCSPT